MVPSKIPAEVLRSAYSLNRGVVPLKSPTVVAPSTYAMARMRQPATVGVMSGAVTVVDAMAAT